VPINRILTVYESRESFISFWFSLNPNSLKNKKWSMYCVILVRFHISLINLRYLASFFLASSSNY
jgi:hypothetical protein